jgi:hypothetical protein
VLLAPGQVAPSVDVGSGDWVFVTVVGGFAVVVAEVRVKGGIMLTPEIVIGDEPDPVVDAALSDGITCSWVLAQLDRYGSV